MSRRLSCKETVVISLHTTVGTGGKKKGGGGVATLPLVLHGQQHAGTLFNTPTTTTITTTKQNNNKRKVGQRSRPRLSPPPAISAHDGSRLVKAG